MCIVYQLNITVSSGLIFKFEIDNKLNKYYFPDPELSIQNTISVFMLIIKQYQSF